MLQDPGAVWQVIHEFLDANHQHNYWKVDKWIQAVNDYKQTLSKIKINTNHVSWQIWATALLQEQDITPSFDLIDNSQDRIERIADVVEDLCQQDLASFYKECYNVCKYNQELYTEMRHRVPRELPNQFHQFINQHVK
jgi:hypothetical protein